MRRWPDGWLQPGWRVGTDARHAGEAARRTWTLLGTAGGEGRGLVDRFGLVAAQPGWSIDVGVRAGADWVFGAERRSQVTQNLLRLAPVVETVLRLGANDGPATSNTATSNTTSQQVTQRSFATRSATGTDWLVTELVNNANVAIAVAVAIRPYDPAGPGRIATLEVEGRVATLEVAFRAATLAVTPRVATPEAAGQQVWVNGQLALVLEREPGEVLLGTGEHDTARQLENRPVDDRAAEGPATDVADGDADSAPNLTIGGSDTDQATGRSIPASSHGQRGTGRAPDAADIEPSNGEAEGYFIECPNGLANGVMVFPLVNGSRLRWAMPLGNAKPPEEHTVKRRRRTQRQTTPAANSTSAGSSPDVSVPDGSVPHASARNLSELRGLATAEAVANGWREQADAASRWVLPPGGLARAFDAARTQLPLALCGNDVRVAVWGPEADQTSEAEVLCALVGLGYGRSVAEVLVERARQAGRRGDVRWLKQDVSASTLIAAGALARLGAANEALLRALEDVVAAAARWILAQRKSTDAALRLAALKGAAAWLSASGAQRAADEVRKTTAVLEPPRDAAHPNQPQDASASAALAAAALGERSFGTSGQPIAAPDRHEVTWEKSAETAAQHATSEGTAPAGNTADLRELARVAAALARTQPPRALGALDELLGYAGSTFTWPTHATAPPTSCATQPPGCGHDLVVSANFALAVRDLFVHERTDPASSDQLELLRCWPDAWLGAEVEAHSVPTAFGQLSFALRWHGERPALLWEVTPPSTPSSQPGLPPTAGAPNATATEVNGGRHPPTDTNGSHPGLTVTAPGLDPGFVGRGLRGEALLAIPSSASRPTSAQPTMNQPASEPQAQASAAAMSSSGRAPNQPASPSSTPAPPAGTFE